MASSSSSDAHPNHTDKYDVFLSFRGEDTRHTFTDHLYHALVQAGLSTFRDNDEIDRGEELKPEIESAIIRSRASIVVLSENYATSRWCLDELCLILDQRRKLNRFVLPIFYHVDPSDVRNQRGKFAIKRSKRTEVSVKRWKAALTEVANLTGMEVSGSETNFIAKVIETVESKLDLKQLSLPPHLTGMETRIEVINSLLKNEQSNIIIICGMGGSGKSTLAQCVFNLNKQDFESSSFVEEVGKHYKTGVLGLQKKLLKDVLKRKKVMISTVSEGTHKINEVLQKKKVLIVLDDIDDQDELSTLLGTKAFPTHSKIVITTRHLDIRAWFEFVSWRCQVHNIQLLNDHESLELLCLCAFGSKTPTSGFEELAIQLAQYCGGNPLALKVLGSSLVVREEESWKRNNMIEIWKSRMNSLNSFKGDLDSRIDVVLKKSFDSLPLRSHRELLLHIACFFVGEYSVVVKMLLEDELQANYGLSTLVNRCLLTISSFGVLKMHQLLQEMARKVVSQESEDPAKRRRVWHDVESYRVLRKGDGSHSIEGLSLDMRKVVQGLSSAALPLKTSSLANMVNLKLLQLKYVTLTGSYEKFPDLIWLCWHGFPLKTIPSGLLMSSLVVIDMKDGQLEKFEVPMVLNSLKRLYLKDCDKLVSICNLWRLPRLQVLILCNCSSLTHLCKSIGDLENLDFLDLSGCTKLWKYVNQPETMMVDRGAIQEQLSFSLPKSLRWLNLSCCGLEFNNDVFMAFHAQSLAFSLFLMFNPFKYLSSNIDLKMLWRLNLYSCPNLKSLPCIPSTLVELYISWCTSLERLTFQSGRFSLQGFSYECCFKLSEVQGLFKLVPIAETDEADLGHMKWIKAYENHKVDLVGDEITKGRIWHTQMLYEYGIMSTHLQGIKDQSMPTYEYTTSGDFLSFHVPKNLKKNRIRGLDVSCSYRSPRSNIRDVWNLWVKISNKSKGLTWVYNPMVYCRPKVDEDVVWVTYWPIGSILDAGDEVSVSIYTSKGKMIVSGCGASLVYMDSVVDEEAKYENNSMKEDEVIGGDLSEFEVAVGCYYLCRYDNDSETLNLLKYFFGDNVHYTDSRWRKALRSIYTSEYRDYLNTIIRKIEMGVNFSSESEITKIEKAVSSIVGVESVSAQKEIGKLIVVAGVDPLEVVTRVREFDNVAEILSIELVLDKESE